MKNKRLEAIKDIITHSKVGSQDEILIHLNERGFTLTQATLSRDLKQMKVAKVPNDQGGYIYTLPFVSSRDTYILKESKSTLATEITIEFSGSLAVLKTKPGYAGGIASDIDTGAPEEIIGT
ncbi:MAG: arginine repressor, partial [Bacteroidales bacterium]